MRAKPLLGLLLSGCLAAACNGGHPAAKVSSTPTTSPTPTASPTPAPVVRDFLTGRPGPSTATVVGVKVDNAPLAKPYQTGLDQAAVIYQELAEGGLTRFLAVFESDKATAEVGPIRSARQSDMELISAYGQIPLAFSGAQPGVIAIVNQNQKAKHVWNADYDNYPGAYRLGAQRKDARNFFAKPSTIAQVRPGSTPRDIGFRFGPESAGGVATPSATAAFSTSSRVGITYLPASKSYRITQNGFVMKIAAQNVILQRVSVHSTGFRDVHHQPTPFTVTTGSGGGYVLRDGKRFLVHWTRAGLGATHFIGTDRKDVQLSSGQTVVLLVPTSGSVAFGTT